MHTIIASHLLFICAGLFVVSHQFASGAFFHLDRIFRSLTFIFRHYIYIFMTIEVRWSSDSSIFMKEKKRWIILYRIMQYDGRMLFSFWVRTVICLVFLNKHLKATCYWEAASNMVHFLDRNSSTVERMFHQLI